MAQTMEDRDSTYRPNYRFVDKNNSGYGRSDQSHAQKESARMRQWERRKDLIGSISRVGGLPWTQRSTHLPADQAPGPSEQDGLVKGDPCVANTEASRSPKAAASCNPVSKGSVSGSGGSIVKLKAQYTDPFEIFVVPIKSKYVDGLWDFLHNRMISDLYEMTVHERKMWPISDISAFALRDTASSYALFSLIAFGQNAAFNGRPGLEAIAYKVRAIQFVNNRLMNPGDASDGTIMAVTLLWQLEAHFDDFARCKVHIDGLQQMIQRRGSLENLAEELLWEIAWCAASLPGSLVLPQRINGTVGADAKPSLSVAELCTNFDELFNTLTDIHKLSTSTNVPFRVFADITFSGMRVVLDRLIVAEYANDALFRSRTHIKSSCRLAVLLSILTLFLEHRGASHEQRRAEIRRQLCYFQQRMLAHNLDRQGSIEKLWHVIVTKHSTTKVALENREWHTVRLMNLAKQLSVGTMDEIAVLLWAYLTEGTKDGRLEGMYAKMMERIKSEVQTEQMDPPMELASLELGHWTPPPRIWGHLGWIDIRLETGQRK